MDLKWSIYYRLDCERNFSLSNDEIYEIFVSFAVSLQLKDE